MLIFTQKMKNEFKLSHTPWKKCLLSILSEMILTSKEIFKKKTKKKYMLP